MSEHPHRRWSDREVMQLHLAAKRGDIFIVSLAQMMHRTPRSVLQKARSLRLSIAFSPKRAQTRSDEQLAAELALRCEIELAKAEAPYVVPYKIKWG